ncbi:MAG: site-specific DNA-methyltransferase [Leptospiraceae bacterium]|nr:site-specific DNA-methyltransferase [Leptospiraceae bacterium]
MEKLKMQTPNLVDKHIESIGRIFPNVITEIQDEKGNLKKAIDFDLLKQQLSDVIVEDDNERYRLDWPGKKASLLKANTPINKTLRPVVEESVNFDTTENLYIEGDNFEVLKILQESYLGKVKMIYIDPPYNTGNDFIYKDDYKMSKDEYEEELGIENEDGEKLFRNTDTNGRFHSDWLSMIYERLVVARDLLKEDGVIFISIDDNEVHNLRKICDEIFGEDNFIANLLWQKKTSPDARMNISAAHDHILLFGKQSELNSLNFLPIDEQRRKNFTNPDNDPRGDWASVDMTGQTGRAPKSQFYTITTPAGVKMPPPEGRCWALAEQTFKNLLEDNRIWFGKDGTNRPRLKNFLSESKGIRPWTWWDNKAVGHNQEGAQELKSLFDNQVVFDNPKPTRLLQRIIHLATSSENNDIILDFYSGSGTIAHSVFLQNAIDNGNRKFLLVQLHEDLQAGSNDFKANSIAIELGYKTIADIGKERIRRAGKKILDEFNQKNKQLELGDNNEEKKLDIGFRVYKVDSSNMKDVYYHPTELNQDNLLNLESNIKEDRTPEDLLTQVILDLGLELNLPIERKKINKNNVFFVQENSLVACFEDKIDFSIIDEIAKIKPLKVVFKDASFKDDKDRINLEERFKRLSPETSIMVL